MCRRFMNKWNSLQLLIETHCWRSYNTELDRNASVSIRVAQDQEGPDVLGNLKCVGLSDVTRLGTFYTSGPRPVYWPDCEFVSVFQRHDEHVVRFEYIELEYWRSISTDFNSMVDSTRATLLAIVYFSSEFVPLLHNCAAVRIGSQLYYRRTRLRAICVRLSVWSVHYWSRRSAAKRICRASARITKSSSTCCLIHQFLCSGWNSVRWL